MVLLAMKTTLFNSAIAPGVNVFACTYSRKSAKKTGAMQTEFFAENDQTNFNRDTLRIAQVLYEVGAKFFPSELRQLAPALNPAKPESMWGQAFRHLQKNGFKMTMNARKSTTATRRGSMELEYERYK